MSSRSVILLAEDNPGDVLLIRDALQGQLSNFDLLVAEDGDKVISFLDRFGNDLPGPDILLLDLNLPRVDGPDMFRRIREHPLCTEVPLVVISSSDLPRDRAWTDGFRVACYFRKPSTYDAYMKLGEVVNSLLANKRDPLKSSGPGEAS